MKQYIGTKLIEAEPAYRVDGKIYPVSGPVPRSINRQEGYKVRYVDSYESWSPKAAFEKAYLPLTVNSSLKTDAPSISQEMVDNFIMKTEVITMGEKCTVVRAVLCNGFEIVESSACVSKENYDEKLGAEICMKKIRNKVWELLGFLLQTAVHGTCQGTEGKTEALNIPAGRKAIRKAMLSQPMGGKTDGEIVETRERAIAALTERGYEIVNTLFTDEWYSRKNMEARGVVQIPLCFLAKSLENMSLCHAAYFCKGWENARGCRIEHEAAKAYGLEIIYEDGGNGNGE